MCHNEGRGFISVALKEYKRVYENILAVEKKLDIARKHLVRDELWRLWRL